MTSFRRRDFIQSFYGRLQGLRQLPPERRFGAAGYDQNPRYEVVDRVTAPGGLRIVTEIHYLKQITTRPVKVYEVDPLLCPRCGSEMKVIALILDPGEIQSILRHLVKIGRAPPDVAPASLN